MLHAGTLNLMYWWNSISPMLSTAYIDGRCFCLYTVEYLNYTHTVSRPTDTRLACSSAPHCSVWSFALQQHHSSHAVFIEILFERRISWWYHFGWLSEDSGCWYKRNYQGRCSNRTFAERGQVWAYKSQRLPCERRPSLLFKRVELEDATLLGAALDSVWENRCEDLARAMVLKTPWFCFVHRSAPPVLHLLRCSPSDDHQALSNFDAILRGAIQLITNS